KITKSTSNEGYVKYIKITPKATSAYTITAQSNNNSYGTVSLSGSVITATPNTGYRVSTSTPYTVTSGTATVTDNGDNTFTVSPSSNCTVQINFEARPTYTVTWHTYNNDNYTTGSPAPTTSVYVGDGVVNLPTNPSPDAGWECADTFMGWSESNLGSTDNQSAPTDLFTTASGAPAITKNTHFYAVFAKASSGGPVTWTQTTSVAVDDEVVIAQIDDGTKEMIGFNKDITTANNYGTYATFSTNPTGTLVWTVEAGNGSGQFSFKNGNYYLNLASDNNYLNGSSTKDNNSSWTVSTSSSRAVVTNVAQTARKIMWNANSGSNRFASYNKNHGENNNQYYYLIVFYKKSGGITYSNYVTTCNPNQVTVHYDANGGSTVCADATYDKTTHPSHTVCSTNPTHPESHHVFVKWNTALDGSGTDYRANNVIADVQSSITLYAQWGIECSKLATPNNISAVVTTHSLNLTWDVVPNATQYRIIIRDEDAGTTFKNETRTGTSYSTSTLEDAHNYSYQIIARGDGSYYCDSDPAGPTDFATLTATKYTVTFTPGSGTCATTSLVTDQIKSMPVATSKCDGWTFIGWSATKASEDPENPTTSRPTLITASSSTPYEPTSNVTLYAVYEGSGSAGGNYTLVESDLGSDWSGKYCIGYDDTHFMDGALAGGTSGIGASGASIDPSTNLSGSTIAQAWGDAHCLTLQKNGDIYTLQTLTGDYIYRSSNSNGMESTTNLATATSNGLSVEWNSDADALLVESSAGPRLQYNTTGYFRFYKSAGQKDIKYYKQIGGGKSYVHDAKCVSCEDATASFERATLTLTLDGTSAAILAAPNTYTSTNGSAVSYTSSNTSVATVNSSTGALTLVGAGETIIKATQARYDAGGGSYVCPVSAQYVLTVKAPSVDIVGIASDGNGIVIEHDLDGAVIHIDELVPVTEGETATELFFSKYFEAKQNVKMVAIFNGTDHAISLEDIRIRILGDYPQSFMVRDVFEELPTELAANTEAVLLAWQTGNGNDEAIIACADDNAKWGEWYKFPYTWDANNGSTLAFGGRAAIILERVDEINGTSEMLDLIGAINNDGTINTSGLSEPSWGDASGWTGTGLEINSDVTEIELSTNRCLLLRDKHVTSGKHAVEANTGSGNFVTLGKHLVNGNYVYEWHGLHVDKSDNNNTDITNSCNGFTQIAEYNYRNYYINPVNKDAEYTSVSNGDGTQTINFDKGTNLSEYSCKILNIQVKKNGEVRMEEPYKVPIIVSGSKSTDDAIFNKFSSDQCADCDVVVLGEGSLSKLNGTNDNDRPTVRNLDVYAGATLTVPADKTYSVNSLRLRGTNQTLPEVKLAATATLTNRSNQVYFDRRLDENHWYWMTLPYDVNTANITLVDGTPAILNSDYFIMYYDGAKRATNQTGGNWVEITSDRTLRTGEGFVIGVTPRHNHDFVELRFPMAGVIEAEFENKTAPVDGNSVKTGIRPNHVGWNLIGDPFMAGFKKGQLSDVSNLKTGTYSKEMENGKWTGYWTLNDDSSPYVTVRKDIDGSDYEQKLVSAVDLSPFDCFFIQIGNSGATDMSFPTAQRNLSPSYVRNVDEDAPFRTGVKLTGAGGSDETGLLIGKKYTSAYEFGADLSKEFGSVYSLKTYTLEGDICLAFNALNVTDETIIPLGYRAPQEGNYTFSLDDSYSIEPLEAIYLIDYATEREVNLLREDYSFATERTQNNTRFALRVIAKQKEVATGINNLNNGLYTLTAIDYTLVLDGLFSPSDIYVYDIEGRLITSAQVDGMQSIWRTTVPAIGVYFVRVNCANGQQTLRTIVK
ncbi:MAG: T9SS type A sorting domain-containing protein, partial [Paludibacteraceae bacterium]|nr:T9SS type A sorting domain-containing protein [Paludibacteraceae bacterium]